MNEEGLKGKKLGTTMKGIGPAYADKANRVGIRVGELGNFEKFSELFAKLYDVSRI